MLFSKLYTILVKKVTFVGFGKAIVLPWIRPCYQQPTCLCVKEFVISLSCELYSLSRSCFRSCGVGTVVYGKGCFVLHVSCCGSCMVAQNIRQGCTRVWFRGVVEWERVPTPFCTSNVTWRCGIQAVRLKHGCDLTDVLATRRFVLLAKSLQWNRKIKCGNSGRRMFVYIQNIWCSLPFYLMW